MSNPDTPNSLPTEIHSKAEGRNVLLAAAKHRAASFGVVGFNLFVIGATTLGITFCLLLDAYFSGEVGAIYFEPVPGQQSNNAFGTKTILAAIVLSALALEIAAIGKQKSRLLDSINRWAPRFSVLFIFGASAAMYSAMSGALSTPGTGDWGIERSFIESVIAGFNESFARPIAEQFFILTFAPVLVVSAFALGRLGRWWFEAVSKIVNHLSCSSVISATFDRLRSYRTAYRPVASEYNAEIDKSLEERQESFALLVFQTMSALTSEMRKQVRSEQGGGFYAMGAEPCGLTSEDIQALESTLSYKSILAAIRGEETNDEINENS